MRMAAIKRKSMADTPCAPGGDTCFGLSLPQPEVHLHGSQPHMLVTLIVTYPAALVLIDGSS